MSNINNKLASYIDALYPIIYINHFDFNIVDNIVRSVKENSNVIEYNNALGVLNFDNKSPMLNEELTLEKFLKSIREYGYDEHIILLLKDVHKELENINIISLLKRIAEDNLYREGYNCTVIIASSKLTIPYELENYITILDIDLPGSKEISNIINEFKDALGIEIDRNTLDEITLSFKGLNEFQIRQILNLAYQDGGYIDSSDRKLILQEKQQFIKKSGLLELIDFKESIKDIGGLENLKEWLERKSKVFKNLDKALKFGVDIPKGIMLVGMPGCGKSLTAKATARLFEVPLVRLDIGRLMGKYIGESEENMRQALKLSESISPCVLWIDEIEKAFSGVGGSNGGSDVTTRLFGQFLTWMQEKENTVFIVATANDISKIPPEFFRKGRFDELFFADLPNDDERKKILEIHIKKRRKWHKDIDTIKLMKETKGYNGADLEYVVKETIETAFIDNKDKITTQDFLDTIKETKSISHTLKDKLNNIKESVKNMDMKSASK
ncbi:MAG: AAA family ATPase [Peptostreptococcaceae bacterium]|nr:AAA family ATPase [Peptostreptococcaceae bacterium]